jgi:hypothetical protein
VRSHRLALLVWLPLALGLSLSPGAPAQSSAQRPEILVLGTYHMANPGHDIHNMQADDVLSPKRQQEIAQLLDVLRRFHPTMIAIESDPDGSRPQQYADYLSGTHTLSRNEIEQIGFRLAKELGHTAIYPVDVDGDFPYERVVNWAKANGKGAAFDSLEARTGARVAAENSFLQSHTVLEMLEYMNSDSLVAQDVAAYFAWIPYGDTWEYAGSDLVAAWYQRNTRIYHNIVALIKSPNDRILVIYGAGHLGWLRQMIASDTSVRLRKLADLF